MIATTFSTPPTTRKNVTLYQHAQEVIRVVSTAKETLESLDNQDQIDLNRLPGEVVVDSAYRVGDLTPRLAGAIRQTPVHYLSGQIKDAAMEANLSDDSELDGYDLKASYKESSTEKVYQLATVSTSEHQFHPGTITVRQDKATGQLSVEQASDFPWQFTSTYCNTTSEGVFPGTGPKSTEDIPLYRSGQELRDQIETLISQTKIRDNGPEDLNPEKGRVVTTGLGTISSDNWITDRPGTYNVPVEAQLKLDASGKVVDFSAGFGDKTTAGYHQDPSTGMQSYRSDGFAGYASLDIQPNGSQIVRIYDHTEVSFDSQILKQESTVSSGVLSRLLDIGAGAITAGGAAGAIGAGIAAAAAGVAAIPLATAALAGALTAGAINHLCFQNVALKKGINRFEGIDPQSRFAAASYAHQHRSVGKYGENRNQWEFGQQGMTRQQSLEIIEKCQRIPAHGHLSILVQQLGKDKEPAVVLIPTDSAYPVRNGEIGLDLPGGLNIPYASIRGVIDWTA